MRLFYALLRRRENRIVKPVTKEDISRLRLDFEREEKNMFYLRHAYLTPEQSWGHSQALGNPKQKFEQILATKKDFYNNVTLEDRLGHLRHRESWD